MKTWSGFGLAVLALSATLAVPRAAGAQEGPSATAALDDRRQQDASVDRNILAPTAEGQPEGTWSFNDYEVLMAGLSYGATESLQLSATTLLPITTDIPFVLLAAGKLQLVRKERLIFSLMPNVNVLHDTEESPGGPGEEAQDDSYWVGTFGAVALLDYLLDADGRYVATFGANAYGVFVSGAGESDIADGVGFWLYSGIAAAVSSHVKLMGELVLPAAYSNGDFEFVEEALLFSYGIRFYGNELAADLSFLRPIHPDVDTGPLLMGVPYVTFTARF